MATPREMRAWQYSTVNKPFESNLSLNTTTVPIVPSKGAESKQCILVKVHAASINPADHKAPLTPLVGKYFNRKPATPGMDYAGIVVQIPAGIDTKLKEGDRVFGRLDFPYQRGTIAEYTLAQPNCIAKLPDNATFAQGAGLGTAVLSAYQSLEPYVKPGDSVFINGGSGGVGSFAIQIAKLLGASHVTVTCSAANEARVKALGADEVIDYTTTDPVDFLKDAAAKEGGRIYDHVVENVGQKTRIYEESHHFLKKGGYDVQVAAPDESLREGSSVLTRKLRPGFLGGGKRGYVIYLASNDKRAFERISGWLGEGKLQVPIDSEFKFEQAVEAFVRSQSKRAKGKIIVHIVDE